MFTVCIARPMAAAPSISLVVVFVEVKSSTIPITTEAK
jgi:hypothetical protein